MPPTPRGATISKRPLRTLSDERIDLRISHGTPAARGAPTSVSIYHGKANTYRREWNADIRIEIAPSRGEFL